MYKESRTYKSIKNSFVSLSFVGLNIFLQFFSRKIFLEKLGGDILGLNSTLGNILQLLNLAELGIGSAVAFSLYYPISKNDWNLINEIITLQSSFYRKIAGFIILGAIGVMLFFPVIFSKIQLPLWYAYASFLVLLFSVLLSYYFNYKQVILSADQKDYKISYTYRTSQIIKVIFQIVCINYLNNPYIWWLVLEVIFAIIGTIALSNIISSTYSKLKIIRKPIKELIKQNEKLKTLITKIKQVFFHQIAGVALVNSSPIIIYTFESLELVTKYMNYMIIVNGLTTIFNSCFRSLTPGVGNLISTRNIEDVKLVFTELYSFKFLIVSNICIVAYFVITPFISIWIGKEFVLENNILVLICLLLFMNLNRSTVDSFLQGYGLVKDIWAPILECILNIFLSCFLGYKYGLFGILLGVLISLFIIVGIWKPIFLFLSGFRVSIKSFIVLNIKLILCLIFNMLISYFFIKQFQIINNGISMCLLFGLAILMTCGYIGISFILGTILFPKEMGAIFSRIRFIIRK